MPLQRAFRDLVPRKLSLLFDYVFIDPANITLNLLQLVGYGSLSGGSGTWSAIGGTETPRRDRPDQ